MKEMTRKLFHSMMQHGFLYTILCLIVGLLLTVWPIYASLCTVLFFVTLMTCFGVFYIVRYFLSEKEVGAQKMFFFQGLSALEISILAALVYFCGLSVTLALYLGAMGIISSMRFQCMIDMIRRNVRIWYIYLIISCLLLFIAALPFIFDITPKMMYRIVGIVLLVEFVDDFIYRLIIKTMDE